MLLHSLVPPACEVSAADDVLGRHFYTTRYLKEVIAGHRALSPALASSRLGFNGFGVMLSLTGRIVELPSRTMSRDRSRGMFGTWWAGRKVCCGHGLCDSGRTFGSD